MNPHAHIQNRIVRKAKTVCAAYYAKSISNVKWHVKTNPMGVENIGKEIKKMLNEDILKDIETNCKSFNLLLDGNDYQSLAMRTANKNLKHHEQLINGALGLCGESGEVADMVKKCFMQGHELDVEHLAKELGDCMWYIALIADCIGYGLNGIMAMNVDKLKARYPDGFDTDKSQNRKMGDV